MNYIVCGMTSLRYFLPLINEAKKEGHQVHKVFLMKTGKYNCPLLNSKNNQEIYRLAAINGFDVHHVSEIKDHPGLTFMIEADGVNHLGAQHTKVSMTYMTDFRHLYNRYVDSCDYIIFPSKIFASHYGCLSEKNLYFGSTKYDYNFSKENRLEEITKTSNEKALIIYPRYRDLHKLSLKDTVSTVKELGYDPIIKYRMKEPVKENYGCETVCDEYWYPHVTLDLINQSKFVINTGSTTMKESILLKKPIVSLNIKPEVHLPFLSGYNFEESLMAGGISSKSLKTAITKLLSRSENYEFNKCIDEKLFQPGETSKKILKFFKNDNL